MITLACLSLDSVGPSAPVVNLGCLQFPVEYLIFIFSFVHRRPSTDDTAWVWIWVKFSQWIPCLLFVSWVTLIMPSFGVAVLSCYQCSWGGRLRFCHVDWLFPACTRPYPSWWHSQLGPDRCPDLCQVSVSPSVGRFGNSALLLTLTLVEPAPPIDLAFSVPLLSRVNWSGVRDALSSTRWGPIFKSH